MSVSVVAKNICRMTGEGPCWEESSQSLLYVDIGAGDIHRWNTVTEQDTKLHFDKPVTFVIPRSGGGYVAGLGRSICAVDWDSGTATPFCEVELRGTNNRLNDAKCDSSGRLWTGTMGHEVAVVQPEPEMGVLYSLERDHSLRSHLDKVHISNGFAWTSDNRTMYYIDSIPRKVYAFDFDISAGTISNQRTVVDFEPGTKDVLGYPDGMCIDTEGKIWVACYGVGKVIRFDPETGTQLQTVQFEGKCTTSCCFAGPHLTDLYVTCGTVLWYDFDQPLAGSLFKVTGLGVHGTPTQYYQG